MKKSSLFLAAFAASAALAVAGCVSSDVSTSEISADASAFEVFAPPQADTAGVALDYGAYDEFLGTVVYTVGPSDRTPASKPLPMTGSRVRRQHTSRYRYEGNRIVYSIQPAALEKVTAEIVDSFKAVAESETFDQMNADDQLAFWLNFHNALLINQISAQYPVRFVNRVKAVDSKEWVFDAKIVTVRDVPLSLNDIKQNIVFRYWDDPLVMYGFFTGAIGGPNIRQSPYRGSSVYETLRSNGREFVNSLRGVEVDRTNHISWLYNDALPLFDGSWDAVIDHMETLATADTKRSLNSGPVRADVFDWVIADVSYGEMPAPINNQLTLDSLGLRDLFASVGLSPQAEQFIKEVEVRKLEAFRLRGGQVTIDDLPDDEETEDDADEAPSN